MKATKNMNIAEIKTALDKYTAKHPVTDKFDLQAYNYASMPKI